MAGKKLTLIANPGSASRKYALYDDRTLLASVHFETLGKKVVYSYWSLEKSIELEDAKISHLAFAATKLKDLLSKNLSIDTKDIGAIGIRVVAPSSYFQKSCLLTGRSIELLEELEPRASLHISATLQEIKLLGAEFPAAKIVGASDSAFHAGKPAYAAGYGISAIDAKKLDIQRYGYHGLSVASTVSTLRLAKKLPARLIVCHLGSGVSVTAVKNGKSIDNTMGYSPLEGPVMATRSGSIDPTATQVIKKQLSLDEEGLQLYLNHRSGLKGISGASDDIRELLEAEKKGSEPAKLALKMYVYRIQQAIGQMVAALGGVDAIVFTGTVGERSAEMRRRIASKLLYLGIALDPKSNHDLAAAIDVVSISPEHHPANLYVVPANEASQILLEVDKLLNK